MFMFCDAESQQDGVEVLMVIRHTECNQKSA